MLPPKAFNGMMNFFVIVRRLAFVLVGAAAWNATAATTNINVGTPGLSCEIRLSGNLSQWDVIQTLKASESTTTVLDPNSSGDQWFYGVRLVTP